MFFSHSALGIELFQDGARMVSIGGKPYMPKLEAFHEVLFQPDTMRISFRDVNVLNPSSFVTKIREAYLRLLVRSTRLSVSLPDAAGRVVLLDLETRFKTKEEGAEIIRWKLKKNVPYEINEMHLDYHVLQVRETGDVATLVSLISRQVVTQYEELLAEAGLEPNQIDFTTFNIYRFFASRLESIENAAFIIWRGGMLSILIFYNGIPDFYRAKELPGGIGDTNRLFRGISSSLLFYKDKIPGFTLNEAFFVASQDNSETMRTVVAEATGLDPILLDASRVVARKEGLPLDGKNLHALVASIGAAVRNL
jgi:type IV pilus assembly protein PilM